MNMKSQFSLSSETGISPGGLIAGVRSGHGMSLGAPQKKLNHVHRHIRGKRIEHAGFIFDN